jgi:hypothetical protein
MRNLLYYVYPADSYLLSFNLQEISRYADQFNRLIVYAALDGSTLDEQETRSLLRNYLRRVDVRIVANDPNLCESAHFPQMLSEVGKEGEDSTFFCHAKGVSTGNPQYKSRRPQQRLWASLMYRENLRDPAFVQDVLRSHLFHGILKVDPNPHDVPAPWYYAGTFFWFSHRIFQLANVMQLPKRNGYLGRWGVEAYPGNLCRSDEGYCPKEYLNVGCMYFPATYRHTPLTGVEKPTDIAW